MNKSGLIEEIAKQANITHKRSEMIINIIFNAMKDALAQHKRIEIRGFGSFCIKQYKPYTGRNPRTGEEIQVSAKSLPYFKVGKELKKRVDS